MTSLNPEDFLSSITEDGIIVPSGPLSLIGMATKNSSHPGVVNFSPSGSCSDWVEIPIKFIDKIDVLGNLPCKAHHHPLVNIQFKKPENPEAVFLSQLLWSYTQGIKYYSYEPLLDAELFFPRLPRIPRIPPPRIPIPGRGINTDCYSSVLGFAITGTGCAIAIASLETGSMDPSIAARICGISLRLLVEAVEECS